METSVTNTSEYGSLVSTEAALREEAVETETLSDCEGVRESGRRSYSVRNGGKPGAGAKARRRRNVSEFREPVGRDGSHGCLPME